MISVLAGALRRFGVAAALLAFAAADAGAQTATLTLEEAIGLARRNNPGYLTTQADATRADWAVRAAYGALLPGASASTSLSWQDAGTQRFGIFNASDFGFGTSTSYYSSSYTLGLNYRLSGASLLAPRREKAARQATEATIDAAGSQLDADVTRAYLAVLRGRDGIVLARAELVRAEENLRLAAARVAVGSAIPLEQRQAEVERGRAEVALLQAQNLQQTEQLRLTQVLGIGVTGDLELTTTFDVSDVPWAMDELITLAIESNPDLRAARATVSSADASVRMAKSAYLPSLSLQAGLSGFTRQAGNEEYLLEQARGSLAGQRADCELFNNISSGLAQPLPGRPANCAMFTLTPDAEARIRAGNDVFPFDFSREPLSVSMTLSLPVFEGFNRERQIEEARVAARTADYRLRGEELRIRTEVSTAWLNVVTARQSVDLEARNRDLADDQLRLARERYAVGVANFIELQDAETIKARGDRAYLEAMYAYHEGLAALEAAVGRPLRPAGAR
ncbi:MAG: TolC family protein [Gemmatimonadetes bacterium]|nr:TolC family protein [Gemmatimonadota bacterium]